MSNNCQSGRPDICARKDGITCPEDSCDIDDGIYIRCATEGCPNTVEVLGNTCEVCFDKVDREFCETQ